MRSTFPILVALLCLGRGVPLHADQLDEFINAQMNKRGITGLSLAIIDGGAIVREQGYGFGEQYHWPDYNIPPKK